VTTSNLITIPAHAFEPANRVDPHGPGLIDAELCGYLHRHTPELADQLDEDGVFCAATAGHPVHNGTDAQLRVRANDETEETN
jgi:hypothetical protein